MIATAHHCNSPSPVYFTYMLDLIKVDYCRVFYSEYFILAGFWLYNFEGGIFKNWHYLREAFSKFYWGSVFLKVIIIILDIYIQ